MFPGVAMDDRSIIYAGSVSDIDVGWNFGLALNATTDLPSLYSVTKLDSAASAGLVVTGIVSGVLLVIAVVVFLIIWRRKLERSKYINLDVANANA